MQGRPLRSSARCIVSLSLSRLQDTLFHLGRPVACPVGSTSFTVGCRRARGAEEGCRERTAGGALRVGKLAQGRCSRSSARYSYIQP